MRKLKFNVCIIFLVFCSFRNTVAQTSTQSGAGIGTKMFEHHYITQDLPGTSDFGYGCPTVADFDNDGDLDYSFAGVGKLYWFENTGVKIWKRHEAGDRPFVTLGATATDVNRDGWSDIIIGGYWFCNSKNPAGEKFIRYRYDHRIKSEIHDIVMADLDGDGKEEVLVLGQNTGMFWYKIPEDALSDTIWERITVTMDVLKTNDHIHGGFFPRGVGDLDGDGDNDIVLPDRWLENRSNGSVWIKHQLPFGKRGPYGLSSRSWVIDLDRDGDQDIVMTDCDQQASRAAWLENNGKNLPSFTAHFLPMSAPGIRGSFHSLVVSDLDLDGDDDILTCDQEDDSLHPEGASPRWYVWENVSTGADLKFTERVILDQKLGGHDALVGDADSDGDPDIFSKVWNLWPGSGNKGLEHGDLLENTLK
ncbi:MAG: VCBS repeat-containing protein [Prolixibacteraceae bacterium]